MADDEETSARKLELATKMTALATRYNGGQKPTEETWRKMFARYDRNKDGRITLGELMVMLEDADIGGLMTRQGWADGIIFQVDHERGNKDESISLDEFMSVAKKGLSVDFVKEGLRRMNKLVDGLNPVKGAAETFKEASSTWGTVAVVVIIAAMLDASNMSRRR